MNQIEEREEKKQLVKTLTGIIEAIDRVSTTSSKTDKDILEVITELTKRVLQLEQKLDALILLNGRTQFFTGDLKVE